MMTWKLALAFLVKAALMVAVFFSLSVWHLSIVTDASESHLTPYPWVIAMTRLIPSPNGDLIGVPINLFFEFGIWPAAVAAFVVAVLWRADTLLQVSGPVTLSAAYILMHSYDHGSAWLSLLEDITTIFIVLSVATIPFILLGRNLRCWIDSMVNMNTTDQGD
jgi:hypothetical protein